jgi:hypothetical protein
MKSNVRSIPKSLLSLSVSKHALALWAGRASPAMEVELLVSTTAWLGAVTDAADRIVKVYARIHTSRASRGNRGAFGAAVLADGWITRVRDGGEINASDHHLKPAMRMSCSPRLFRASGR